MAIRNDYTVASPTNSGTFARSSTGYYWDGTNIVSAASNAERWQEEIECFIVTDFTTGAKNITWSPVPKGLLVEPQSTNYFLQSQTDGYWSENDLTETVGSDPSIISGVNWNEFRETTGTGDHSCNIILTGAGSPQVFSFYFEYVGSRSVVAQIYKISSINCQAIFDVNYSTPRIYINNIEGTVTGCGLIKYGSTGVYQAWLAGEFSNTSANNLYVYSELQGITATWGGHTGSTSAGFNATGFQLEVGSKPTSYIPTSGSTATRNADSNTYSYSTTVGSTGTTFGVAQTPFYPKNGNTVLQSDLAAAGSEYDVSIDYETDGDVVGSSTDPGTPTTVTLTHTFATGDEYKATYNQIEVNGSGDADQNLRFYVDNASVGTPAAHNVSDGDALDGNHIILNGYGGLVHRIAIDDTSDQSGNYSYLSLVTNYDVSITESITVGDTQLAVAAALGALADSLTLGDTQSALAGALGIMSEGVAVGDTQSAIATALGVLIESISTGDIQVAVATALAILSDSITVGDTQSGFAGGIGAFAESITVSDTQSALANAFGILAAENVNLTDLFSGLNVFLASISEGISVGDTQGAIATALTALSESIAAGDAQSAVATSLATLAEGVATGDTQGAVASALAILAAENVNLNDLFTGLQLFLAAITESITVGDSVSAEAAALAAFAESLAAGDASSATATALAALSEGVTNAEVFAAVAAAYASVSEGILVGETWSYPLIGAHLVGTFSIEPLLAASPSNQALLAATVTTEGLEGTTITINR